MLINENFFIRFRNSIVGPDDQNDGFDGTSPGVKFLISQFNMVPSHLETLFCNMTRSYPTSPTYLFLCLGSIGCNISRTTSIQRISSLLSPPERAGTFLKFIGPSRVGKGIALKLLSEIGSHIQDLRSTF